MSDIWRGILVSCGVLLVVVCLLFSLVVILLAGLTYAGVF